MACKVRTTVIVPRHYIMLIIGPKKRRDLSIKMVKLVIFLF